jgi:cytochrome oxidase Cu insertion factor (SCO1/SenC/PrrC family)
MRKFMIVYRRYLLIIFLALILPASPGMYGCSQNNVDTLEVKPPSEQTEADFQIAELLEAANVYKFENPVKAPDFNLTSVKGSDIGLNQYRGKIVLLSFWTTW